MVNVARSMLALALLATAAAAQERADGGAPPPAGCPQAIGPDNAQRLFAALKDEHGADGCALEEVRTEKEVMRVEWRKGGVPAPLIEIRPTACGPGSTVTGPEFAMSAPAGAVEQCPAAVEKMKSLIASERFGGAVRLGATTTAGAPPEWHALAIIGAAVVVLLGGVIVFWRRRRKPAA